MKCWESDNRDRLTGLATEAALTGFVADALDRSVCRGLPVCFIQIDVDGLAGIHQELGAAVADAVLLGVADCVNEGIRTADLAGRSAEGFGICMVGMAAAQARAAAERLRLRVLANPVATGNGPLHVTCSIGFGVCHDTRNDARTGAAWLVGRAREARRAAQCEGGDRVIAAA